MRLSTQQYFFQGVSAITDLNSQVSRAQQQISSGRQVLTASDDPASAARILRLESQVDTIDQYQKNIDFAESGLETTEQALSAMELVLDRIRELLVSANGPAVTEEERSLIAVELSERVDEMLDLVNTRDEQGDYIFSGFNSDAEAFVRSSGGQFIYQGDNGVKRLQISDASFLTVAENGSELFDAIPVNNSQIAVEAAVGNSTSFAVVSSIVEDRAVFDAFYPEDYVVTFNSEASVVPNGPNYSVSRVSDGSAVVSNVPYVEANGIAFDGLLLNGVGSPQPGDQFTVESVTSQNMLATLEGISNEITSLSDSTERQSFFIATDSNLDAIQNRLLEARTRVGVSLNRLETTRNTLADRKLSQESLLSEVRDLDYAAAISNLSFISFVLEASQASFSRISNLSLFNYLR